MESIRILVFRKNSLKTLLSLSGHPSLEFLEASSNLLERIEFDPISPKLKALILVSNSILEITTMAVLPNLELLNLSGNKFTAFRFERFPRLTILNYHSIRFKVLRSMK
jgi:Leucine-rich repeat (LRR) protein